jgi:hypothetical protein
LESQIILKVLGASKPKNIKKIVTIERSPMPEGEEP